LNEDSKILDRVDKSAPLETQAKQAFDMRNENRAQAREFMSDRVSADRLIGEEPNMTWSEMIDYRKSQGLSGDDIYRAILDSSQRTRAEVNKRLGVD
jgi:filamentous hemagglutinin